MKLYFVIPDANNGGGVWVIACLAAAFLEAGYKAFLIIRSKGTMNPQWNFTCDVVDEASIEDSADNILITSWGADLVDMFDRFKKIKFYHYAQDTNQNMYVFGSRFVGVLVNEQVHLITLGHHGYCYWLYRYGKRSVSVTNFVDTKLFFPPERKIQNLVMMLSYRNDYADLKVAQGLVEGNKELIVKSVSGTRAEVADAFKAAEYFVSCTDGVMNGLNSTEGWPLPVHEAMAAGCIVFTKDTHGVHSFMVHGVNGFIYQDAEEILETIKWLNDNLEAKALIIQASMFTARGAYTLEYAFKKFESALMLDEAEKCTWWDKKYNSTTVKKFLGADHEGVGNKSRSHFRKWLLSNEIETLLDVGCGRAVELEGYQLFNIPVKYTGLDFSRVMIDHCREYFPASIFLHGTLDMFEVVNKYDVVLCRHVLEHVGDYRALIKQAVRFSSDYVVFILFRDFDEEDSVVYLDDAYDNRIGRDSFFAAIEDAGLDVSQIWVDDCPEANRIDRTVVCTVRRVCNG